MGCECTACGRITGAIDTERHGYYVELAARKRRLAKFWGDGPRPAQRCPRCGCQWFGLTLAFNFWDAMLDLADDESRRPF